MLPGNLRARANVNYFSSIVSSQTFNTNIYDISRNQRSFGGNVVGAWRNYTLNATLDHSEYSTTPTTSSISGSWPASPSCATSGRSEFGRRTFP